MYRYVSMLLLIVSCLHVNAEVLGDKVIARSGDYTITIGELYSEIDYIRDLKKIQVLPDASTLQQMVSMMLDTKLVADEARSLGIQNRRYVKQRMRLEQDRLLARVRMYDLLNQEPDMALVEQSARERYLADKKEYMTVPEAALSHILIKVDESRDEETALQQIERLHSRLTGDAEQFKAVAKKLSEDPGSRQKGGSLGWAKKTSFVKPFAEAAFVLSEPGELSPPVKTRFGYHIIRLDEKPKPARQLSFDEVKAKLIEEEVVTFKRSIRDGHLAVLRNEKNADYDMEAITQFLEDLRSSDIGDRIRNE